MKQPLFDRSGDARSLVADFDDDAAAGGAGDDGDFTAVGHDLNRVSEQVDEDALHAGAVQGEFQLFGDIEAEADVGGGLLAFNGRFDHLAEAAEFELGGLTFGSVEEFLEHGEHAAAGVVDVAGEAPGLGRSQRFGVDQHFGSAVDGGEGIAEVVDDA